MRFAVGTHVTFSFRVRWDAITTNDNMVNESLRRPFGENERLEVSRPSRKIDPVGLNTSDT